MSRLTACSRPALAALAAVLLPACEADPAPAAASQRPNWHEDVGPLFAKHCTGCHSEGGIAPFRLDTYADAKAWAKPAAVAVANRTMPPWAMRADGSCGTYRDARWLSDADIAAVKKWADAGAPQGEVSKAPLVAKTTPTVLSGEVLDLELPVAYAPTPDSPNGLDDHRCFLLDPKLTEDKFVTGFEVLPGDKKLVHHVLAFSVDPEKISFQDKQFRQNKAIVADLQAKEGKPGWPCYAAAGDAVQVDALPATWAPGTGAVHYPAGTGLRLPKGEWIVVQMHYHLGNGSGTDKTKVRLQLAPKVEREGFVVLHDPFLFSQYFGKQDQIAPGQPKAEVHWKAKRKDLDFFLPASAGDQFDIFAIYPHMHKLGRQARLEVRPSSQAPAQCVGDVQQWDFDWQQFYWYDQPIPFGPESVLEYRCTYDTTGLTQPVLPGFDTANEMCLVGLYFVKK